MRYCGRGPLPFELLCAPPARIERAVMKLFVSLIFLLAPAALGAGITIAHAQQPSHDHAHTSGHGQKAPAKPILEPAQGARVKIIAPKEGQIFKGDSVPLEFAMTKGKRGEHVHAYVDGEMVGMFKSTKGTLNGIKAGKHTLELRVGTARHTELDATDRISFVTE
jgi:hypothetical protein